jgi:hypothetical protein
MLAKDLGMTKARLLAEADSQELSEWIALYRLQSKEMQEAQQRAELDSRARSGVEKMKNAVKGKKI